MSSITDVGGVEIIYGDKSGLDGRVGDQFISSISLTGDSEIAAQDDEFGSSLAAGDFNGDGRDDLAIGVPDASTDPLRPGVVYVVYGTALALLLIHLLIY